MPSRYSLLTIFSLCAPFVQVALAAPSADIEGFLEGSRLSLNLRNFYAVQRTSGTTLLSVKKPWGAETTRDRTTWVQAAMLNYSSGYTLGKIGFGLDASMFSAVTLERGHGAIANGADRVLVDSDGDAIPTWSRLAVADVKFKASKTEIKVGRMMVDNPMLRPKDNRALPSSFQGTAISSNEWDWLKIQAGSFDKAILRTGSRSEDLASYYGNRAIKGDRLNYLGATARVYPNLDVSLFGSRFENMWDQGYLGITHKLVSNEGYSLKTAFSYYHTQDQGEMRLGYIKNDAYSLAVTGSHAGHSLTLAWQQVMGDEYFDYVFESTSNYLANALFSDYNGPNEKSWQLRYDLDFAVFGVPGLALTLWHAKGWDIDGTHYNGDRNGHATGYNVRGLDGATHDENGLLLSYVVQSGPLQAWNFKTIVYNHRGSPGQIDGSYDEFRLVTTIPIKIF